MTQSAISAAHAHSIALIDISYIFKKYFHTVNDGTRNWAAHATLRALERLKQGVGHIIVCRDAPPYSHRLAISADYKAQRPTPEPEEVAQKKWLWKEIADLGYNVAWAQGYEADDVIATLAFEYSKWCQDVRIVGTDKDAAQCLNEHVTQYIPPVGDKDWEVRDVAAATAKFGVPPELMVLFQGLMGDAGDNIPGVKGIGKVKAAELANKYKTLGGLAQGMSEAAARGDKSAIVASLAANWETLVMSCKLAQLDLAVPLDVEGLLVKRAPLGLKEVKTMDVNPKQDGVTDAAFDEAIRHYQDKLPELQKAAKDAELLEQETDRERQGNNEHDATSNEPGDKAGESVIVPRRSTALTNVPGYTESKYGLVTKDLQPIDLESARTVSEWLCDGGMYPQFDSPQAVFSVIARGKELGIGMTTALAGHHIIEGKVSASADLIRALVERDPTFEYLYPKEMSATKVVWAGKRKGYPEPVTFSYTIEEARLALGIPDRASNGEMVFRKDKYGNPGNWEKRPQDMLMKTAASKLARLLWPAATMGMYCPEEMGIEGGFEQREAA